MGRRLSIPDSIAEELRGLLAAALLLVGVVAVGPGHQAVHLLGGHGAYGHGAYGHGAYGHGAHGHGAHGGDLGGHAHGEHDCDRAGASTERSAPSDDDGPRLDPDRGLLAHASHADERCGVCGLVLHHACAGSPTDGVLAVARADSRRDGRAPRAQSRDRSVSERGPPRRV